MLKYFYGPIGYVSGFIVCSTCKSGVFSSTYRTDEPKFDPWTRLFSQIDVQIAKFKLEKFERFTNEQNVIRVRSILPISVHLMENKRQPFISIRPKFEIQLFI